MSGLKAYADENFQNKKKNQAQNTAFFLERTKKNFF